MSAQHLADGQVDLLLQVRVLEGVATQRLDAGQVVERCDQRQRPFAVVDAHRVIEQQAQHWLKPFFSHTAVQRGKGLQLKLIAHVLALEVLHIDDAAGEAFDKIARFMGLQYPGGPEIEKLARGGNPAAVDFPRALLDQGYDFSFSGLKSAVINYLHKEKQAGREISRDDVAASFQEAIVDVLVKKSIQALEATGLKKIVLAGGVSANKTLQEELAKAASAVGVSLVYPKQVLCTDNAVMIACRGYYKFINKEISGLDLNADPALKLV